MSTQSDSHLPRRLYRGGGFSLIELTAVMVVVGIIAGTAVVSMNSTTATRAAMAARQLQRDMTFARQRAVASGTKSWIEFDTTNHDWTVWVENPSLPGRINALILTDPATGGSFVQKLNTDQFVGVTLTTVDMDSEDWVGFDWLGRPLKKTGESTPLPTADGTVTFSGGAQVTVNKDTGHIAYVPAP